jgi:hypothetical protein
VIDATNAATTATAAAGILPWGDLTRGGLSIGGKTRPTQTVPPPARTRGRATTTVQLSKLGPFEAGATQSHICPTGETYS